MKYNLIEEAFIPCLFPDSRVEELGIRDTLHRSPEIREIRDDSPLVTVAIHRLLLAIIHRAIEGPKSYADWGKIWNNSKLPFDAIDDYLSKHRESFDIFDPSRPFMQDPTLKTNKPGPVTRLAKECSSGNNATLFDHTYKEEAVHPSPSWVARRLVAEQAYAVAGGNSKRGHTTNGPLVGILYLLAKGNNLFETLALNLLRYDDDRPFARSNKADIPSWEETKASTKESPGGYVDLLSWKSRSIRIQPVESSSLDAPLAVHYAQGRKFDPPESFRDPMVPYLAHEKHGLKPIQLSANKAVWRNAHAILAWAREENVFGLLQHLRSLYTQDHLPDQCYRIDAFGLGNDQARIDFWRHESLPLYGKLLTDDLVLKNLQESLELAESTARALRSAGWLAAKTYLKGGEGEPDTDRVRNLYDSHSPDRIFWSRIQSPFYHLLDELVSTIDPDQTLRPWFDDVLRPTARESFRLTFGSLDVSPRALRASAVGESSLMRQLRELTRNKPTANSQGGV